MTRQHKIVVGALIAVALFLLACGSKKAPGGSVKVPAAVTEDIPHYTFNPPPAAPVHSVDDIQGGWVFTPHRYPRVVGGEITAVIHHGFQTMALPQDGDMLWLSAPPSEEML